MRANERGERGKRILGIGVDAKESDATWSVFSTQRGQPWRIKLGERTFGSEEDDNDDLPVGEVAQRMRFAAVIRQAEIGDGASDAGICLDRLRRVPNLLRVRAQSRGKSDAERQHDEFLGRGHDDLLASPPSLHGGSVQA